MYSRVNSRIQRAVRGRLPLHNPISSTPRRRGLPPPHPGVLRFGGRSLPAPVCSSGFRSSRARYGTDRPPSVPSLDLQTIHRRVD